VLFCEDGETLLSPIHVGVMLEGEEVWLRAPVDVEFENGSIDIAVLKMDCANIFQQVRTWFVSLYSL
jgi:hypothetical protein